MLPVCTAPVVSLSIALWATCVASGPPAPVPVAAPTRAARCLSPRELKAYSIHDLAAHSALRHAAVADELDPQKLRWLREEYDAVERLIFDSLRHASSDAPPPPVPQPLLARLHELRRAAVDPTTLQR
ncbi:MAG: hypothetical protein AAF628_17605 [Planctomycetota bacterium]